MFVVRVCLMNLNQLYFLSIFLTPSFPYLNQCSRPLKFQLSVFLSHPIPISNFLDYNNNFHYYHYYYYYYFIISGGGSSSRIVVVVLLLYPHH